MCKANISLIALYSLTLIAACSTQAVYLPASIQAKQKIGQEHQPPRDDSSVVAQQAPNLFLSWDKPTGEISSYKIYYTREKEEAIAGTLVKTLAKESGKEMSTSVNLAVSALGGVPRTGSKACFYLVAENAGRDSEPSNTSCVEF